MARVLLAGKEWKSRALLRAQLIEEGVEVEAYETVSAAITGLEGSTALPGLFVADLTASDDAENEVDQLAEWTRQVPTWIVASRSQIIAKYLKGKGFEVILFRPVDLGELVEQIKRRLETD